MAQHPWVLPSQAPLLPYPNPWGPPAHAPTSNAGNLESAARTARHQKRKRYEWEAATENKKSHRIRVKSGGEIDVGCDGKNAWNDAVQGYVPKMIDMSIIH
jgi:hypothetical protein